MINRDEKFQRLEIRDRKSAEQTRRIAMKKPQVWFCLIVFFMTGAVFGQSASDATAPKHAPHEYTAYEKLILKNVSQFHKNFNARQFEKNGELVADDLHVDSNGTEVNGREAFVSRIARFVGPFPDVKITDLITVVDGNTAAIRFVITGTQKGDLQTPEGVILATNRPIHLDGAEFFTFDKEGKLVDLVTIENLAQLMQELKGK